MWKECDSDNEEDCEYAASGCVGKEDKTKCIVLDNDVSEQETKTERFLRERNLTNNDVNINNGDDTY